MHPPMGKIRKVTSYFQNPNVASASNEGNLHETILTDSSQSTFKLQASDKSKSTSYDSL